MAPEEYCFAARVPLTLKPQEFGLWTIKRYFFDENMNAVMQAYFKVRVGHAYYTALHRLTQATLHHDGEVVMEDSMLELKKHLPIFMNGRGRILVTGLGLGCVVRGLLAKPEVDHITVVEIDSGIIRVVGKEFQGNPRVTIIHEDALTARVDGKFDFAWHDIWTEGDEHLQVLHTKLLVRFFDQCGKQGAWNYPKYLKRRFGKYLLK